MSKGNARGSGYERNDDDWYVEPIGAVTALFKVERFWGTICDPACGGGTIPKAAIECGLKAVGFDLKDRGYGHTPVDFLNSRARWEHIVCNPPYDLAEEFALHAITVAAEHKVALLVRLAWLEGMGRHERLFKPHPPSRILVFQNRISCPPGGADLPAKGGAVAYCWIVWSQGHHGEPTVAWIKADR